jgi:very-short-patch-repair endonuclease
VPHVTVDRGRHIAPPADLVLHRRDVPALDGVTTLARTAADCCRCLPDRAALVVADAVLAQGVPLAEVLTQARGAGAGHVRRLLARASGLAGSSGETCARLALQDAGLVVEAQVHIPRVGFVDLLVAGRLVVEIDGYAYHAHRRQFVRDHRRDAELQTQGYRVLRFTWSDAVYRPEYVVRVVTAVLAQAA